MLFVDCGVTSLTIECPVLRCLLTLLSVDILSVPFVATSPIFTPVASQETSEVFSVITTITPTTVLQFVAHYF